MSAVLRAKIKVGTVIPEKNRETGEQTSERLVCHAVYSDDPESENKKWSQWTPSFHLDMTINNPGAFGKAKAGDEFYVDFIPVPSEAKEETDA